MSECAMCIRLCYVLVFWYSCYVLVHMSAASVVYVYTWRVLNVSECAFLCAVAAVRHTASGPGVWRAPAVGAGCPSVHGPGVCLAVLSG